MISGGGERSHWVKNLQADPLASVRVGQSSHTVRARFSLDPDERVRAGETLAQKYRPGQGSWSDGFLVAFDPADPTDP
ncbi:MAG: nitroreductase/quinone reductase family protein [Actinomycetota bacterium]